MDDSFSPDIALDNWPTVTLEVLFSIRNLGILLTASWLWHRIMTTVRGYISGWIVLKWNKKFLSIALYRYCHCLEGRKHWPILDKNWCHDRNWNLEWTNESFHLDSAWESVRIDLLRWHWKWKQRVTCTPDINSALGRARFVSLVFPLFHLWLNLALVLLH